MISHTHTKGQCLSACKSEVCGETAACTVPVVRKGLPGNDPKIQSGLESVWSCSRSIDVDSFAFYS